MSVRKASSSGVTQGLITRLSAIKNMVSPNTKRIIPTKRTTPKIC